MQGATTTARSIGDINVDENLAYGLSLFTDRRTDVTTVLPSIDFTVSRTHTWILITQHVREINLLFIGTRFIHFFITRPDNKSFCRKFPVFLPRTQSWIRCWKFMKTYSWMFSITVVTIGIRAFSSTRQCELTSLVEN